MSIAPTSSRLRPSRSLSGPNTSCPSASPATHAVSVSWTDDALVSSARVISGNAGRYMSIDSGPIALTEPRTTMSRALRTGSAYERANRLGLLSR